jgi:CheY-like chemotaxis protein
MVDASLLSGRHILVVEDEVLILLLTKDFLADLGASTTTAATVKQALALIDAQVFDAALLDVNLKGDKSYPVAEALVARGIPFIFSTGYGDEDLTDAYRDRPLLQKPLRRQAIVDMNLSEAPTLERLEP